MAEKITDETTVNTTELAIVLGITARRVQQLAQDGTFLTVKRGRFSLADSVHKYILFLSKRTTPEDEKDLEKRRLEAELKLKESKADMAKMEAEELEGKMHRSEDVFAVTSDLIFTIRSSLASLPGRLAVDTATARTPAETSAIIRKEVHKIMGELANYKYDPKVYEERVRARMKWETVDSDADDG